MFNASKKYKGEIVKLRYMEETVNRNLPTKAKRNPDVHGSRFLLELDIQLHEPEKKLVHTSEYVYLPKDSNELCHTDNFQWRKTPTVDVYLVVSCECIYSIHLWYCASCSLILLVSYSEEPGSLGEPPHTEHGRGT